MRVYILKLNVTLGSIKNFTVYLFDTDVLRSEVVLDRQIV